MRRDFPRIPITSQQSLFNLLCEFGKELVSNHLLKDSGFGDNEVKYPVPGDNIVATGHPKYLAPGQKEPGGKAKLKIGRVYVNKEQYFEGIKPKVWDFHVGGYKVCERWLKDRKGRELSYDERDIYRKITKALSETIRLMKKIDEAIDEHGGWPIK